MNRLIMPITPTYPAIADFLGWKGIPFDTVKLIGKGAPKILRLESYTQGIMLEKKTDTLRELLYNEFGKGVRVYSNPNQETINIEI